MKNSAKKHIMTLRDVIGIVSRFARNDHETSAVVADLLNRGLGSRAGARVFTPYCRPLINGTLRLGASNSAREASRFLGAITKFPRNSHDSRFFPSCATVLW